MNHFYPILIAEDDYVSRILVEKTLTNAGYDVESAENGTEALEKFRKRFFPIVLTDWLMPEMDGPDLCRAIRRESTRYVFIILLTTKSDKDDVVTGLKAGADDYLTKPVNSAELIARINTGVRILELERSLKAAEEQVTGYNERLEEMVTRRTSALQRSEEKYRNILESIEEGYYEINLEGELVFFNESYSRIIGYEGNELKGIKYTEFTDGKNAVQLQAHLDTVLKSGVPFRTFEWELISKNGKRKIVESSASLINGEDGSPTGFRGLIRDVTRRKMMELELVAKRRQAEEASRAKSDFMANMSHEIRTPLNGIIGMGELLLHTRLDDKQKNMVRIIDDEAVALLNLINEILDFSKIEVGKIEIESIPFDLRELMEEVSRSIAPRAQKKGLEYLFFMPASMPSKLKGDPTRLRQILMNLISNSLKFTSSGEILCIIEELEPVDEKLMLRFQIRDTGIGISREYHRKIFDSFTQEDGSTTRKYGGTGLGTTITKQLVEMMDGKIGLSSIPGKGTTFWFKIAFEKQEKTDRHASLMEIHPKLEGKKALIAYHNIFLQIVLRDFLETWGVQTDSAPDGNTLLSHMLKESDSIDFLILDDDLSDLSDNVFVSEMNELLAKTGCQVLILKGIGACDTEYEHRLERLVGTIFKPVRMCELYRMLLAAFEQKFSGRISVADIEPNTSRNLENHEENRKYSILLVEDYKTNQEVAVRHLTNAGYQVDLAVNGRLAVQACMEKDYHLILMDVQMPEMDGYEATKRIRNMGVVAGEKSRGKGLKNPAEVPIIAMTAHAGNPNREKCLQSGMDDFISKPIRKLNLLNVLHQWLHRSDEDESSAPPDGGQTEDMTQEKVHVQGLPIDFPRALDEFEGDRPFLMNLLRGFIENVEKQIAVIGNAINENDAETVRKEAHSIKGGAANLVAEPLSEKARCLEEIGKSGDLNQGDSALRQMTSAYEHLKSYIELLEKKEKEPGGS